ncbi:hypothetical protein EDB19DRAFT_2034652 [Suillus lakei]|nr:hypothetical protein EDB19DRAFT_2034652 [Suillus lakei]
MAASYEPTEQHWDSSSSLSYRALPNPHDDLDSILSNVKSTAGTGTDFYDRGLTSRRYALVGVAFSVIISCGCIATGVIILRSHGVSGVIPLMRLRGAMLGSALPFEILSLILNLLVTVCTESTGFVHNISLRSALASESRLRFNTNLRLLTAARGWGNPNGALLNGIMAVLLIISYSSSSLVVFFNYTYPSDDSYMVYIAVAGFPLLLLGSALLLQVVIAVSGVHAVKILTWSSSPFDVTAALVHHTRLAPAPFRCMCGVSDADGVPTKPSRSQPSAWCAHPSIRKVVISLWGLVVACAAWAGLVEYFSKQYLGDNWAFMRWGLFSDHQHSLPYMHSLTADVPWWIMSSINVAILQGPLTLGLHCSELIVNVIQNESRWRCATRSKGLQTAINPLRAAFANPLGLVLLLVKPALHWMFGLAFTYDGAASDDMLSEVGLSMFPSQIWNLCIALSIFACFFTLVTLRRPSGPQPATYGHLQTLANLVDEWSPVMWWGHKEDGSPYCHAGTSDCPLPDVKMNCVYAGFGIGSSPSVSFT